MKNAMRNAMTLILISLVGCFMVIACANPMSAEEDVVGNGGGLFTVTIGEGTARKTVSWADTLDSSQLTHTITVSGGPGTAPPPQTIPASGGPVQFSVTPGQWTISVEARYSEDKIAIAVGSDTVQIKKGNNGTKNIKMKIPPNYPSYTVTFRYDDSDNLVSSQSVYKYSKATDPNYLNGRVRWYTEQACIHEYDFNNAVTRSITLYGRWGQ
jgi:hypothetical protein